MCVLFRIVVNERARKQPKQFDVSSRLRSNTKEPTTTTLPTKFVQRKCAIQTCSTAEAEELSSNGARQQWLEWQSQHESWSMGERSKNTLF